MKLSLKGGKAKKFKIISALSLVMLMSIPLSGVVSASSGTAYTTCTSSASVSFGSGYDSASATYHVGSGWFNDDAKITTNIGYNTGTYFAEYGCLHTPGTSTTLYINIPKQRTLWVSSYSSHSVTTSGADTGTGYVEAFRYYDSNSSSLQFDADVVMSYS